MYNKKEIQRKVIEEVNNLLDENIDIMDENHPIDLDSFTRVQLLAELEDYFNIIISNDDIQEITFQDIKSVVSLIENIVNQ